MQNHFRASLAGPHLGAGGGRSNGSGRCHGPGARWGAARCCWGAPHRRWRAACFRWGRPAGAGRSPPPHQSGGAHRQRLPGRWWTRWPPVWRVPRRTAHSVGCGSWDGQWRRCVREGRWRQCGRWSGWRCATGRGTAPGARAPAELAPGVAVRIPGSGRTGTVVRAGRRGTWVVETGSVRGTFAANELELLDQADAGSAPAPGRGTPGAPSHHSHRGAPRPRPPAAGGVGAPSPPGRRWSSTSAAAPARRVGPGRTPGSTPRYSPGCTSSRSCTARGRGFSATPSPSILSATATSSTTVRLHPTWAATARRW